MTERVCLRCDWAGTSTDTRCPECGVPLFRPASAAAPKEERSPRRRSRPDPAGPARSRDRRLALPSIPERAQGWVGMAVVVAIAAAAIVAVSSTSSGTTGTASRTPVPSAGASFRPRPPGLTGLLVYSAPESPTTSRLWIWDIQAGTVTRGPAVPTPIELIDAYRAPPTRIGVTSTTGDGTQSALLVSSWRPEDRPQTVLRGQRIAWATGGLEVSAATVRGSGPCGTLEVRSYVPQFNESRTRLTTHVCGQLYSIAEGAGPPAVGLVGGGDASISLVGSASLAPILPHHLLLGASPSDDYLVEPYSCIGPGPGPTRAVCPGLSLFYPSLADRVPVSYGGPGGVLLPERVLGWTPDGRSAYVVGSYVHGEEETRGFFRVRTGPLPLPLRPTLVSASTGDGEQITFTDSGIPILLSGGRVAAILHGHAVTLNRPGGPTPDGPILWVRSLPYSPT